MTSMKLRAFLPQVVYLCGMMIFLSGWVNAQSESPDLKVLDAYFESMVDDWEVPSMSIGIVKDGALVFAGSYGTREVGKNWPPNSESLYAIASNSKAFTSTMLAMLVDEGKINWDDPVKKYVPEFELEDKYLSQLVTVRDLLCHRVGLGTFSGDVVWYKSNLTADEIIASIPYLPLQFNFRSGWGYSNLMYVTAGKVIEVVTEKTWTENVKERILTPLGMDRTIANIDRLEEMGNVASPHAREEGENFPIAWVDWSDIAAMGGLISSVEDMSKWMIFNLNHGVWQGDTLLSAQSRNALWTPHNNFTVDHTNSNPFNRHFSGYGLGWGLSDYHGRLRVGHTGGFDGMLSALNLIPDEKLGVVVLTNGMKSPMMAATYYAIDAFLNLEETDWSGRFLEMTNEREKHDTRISDREASRVTGTTPSLDLEKYTGRYKSDIYGNILVALNSDGELRLSFEHTPEYSSTLRHWHYDVWRIEWDTPQAWFKFGTVGFDLDNNLKIEGMTFDVPNDDIFFDELKPKKVE